jgi:hypothetical protein
MNNALHGFVSARRNSPVSEQLKHEPSAPNPPDQNWFEHLHRIRAEREATGYPFMNEEETNAHVEWLRQADCIDDLIADVDNRDPKPEAS